MARPNNLKTKIFLDGGIPQETLDTIELLGFLDGQTTNPTLVTKHPAFQAYAQKGEKIPEEEAWEIYRRIVEEISPLIPNGSVSIEVYADSNTKASEMVSKGRELFTWIPNAHVKLPTTHEGLVAAETLSKEGIRINMTLCFSQEQAAAVYSATKGAKKGDVFISPFVGRLDDIGENGMDLIANIMKLYSTSDGHVEVLSASIRNMDHMFASLKLKADIITAPFKIYKEWSDLGLELPKEDWEYKTQLKPIVYEALDLSKNWQDFDIHHELTDKGIEKFAQDWNSLISK